MYAAYPVPLTNSCQDRLDCLHSEGSFIYLLVQGRKIYDRPPHTRGFLNYKHSGREPWRLICWLYCPFLTVDPLARPPKHDPWSKMDRMPEKEKKIEKEIVEVLREKISSTPLSEPPLHKPLHLCTPTVSNDAPGKLSLAQKK